MEASKEMLWSREKCLRDTAEGFSKNFFSHNVSMFHSPGRTEIGGNHTDHQNGCVLAAAVDLETFGCGCINNTNKVNVMCEGFGRAEIDLNELTPRESEKNTTMSLVRGVCAGIKEKGYNVSGFDMYIKSMVPVGSGLSSSASFENLIACGMNHFFCDDEINAIEIAKMGKLSENNFFGKPSGLMDQLASSEGGIIFADLKDEDNPKVEKVLFDFEKSGYNLCIINTGESHADLTEDYSAIIREMKSIARYFGKQVLRDVDENEFYSSLGKLINGVSHRAILRAIHFFEENKRVYREYECLKNGDIAEFIKTVNESGNSSYKYLQNVYSNNDIQIVSLALAIAEKALAGTGAVRIHGGGFAGTIQAFVPVEKTHELLAEMENLIGVGSCNVLKISPLGAGIIIE